MKFLPTGFDGLICIEFTIRRDARGTFVKTFHRDLYAAAGIKIHVVEQFHSTSSRGVLRGMHFQTPPAAHAKIVYCSVGSVLDVVVDLRKAAPTFGRAHAVEISEDNGRGLYVPQGFAHGFLTLSEKAVMVYNTDSAYSPDNDTGICWDSFGFDWKYSAPTISARDQALPQLADINSPF